MNVYDKDNLSIRPLLSNYKNVEEFVKTLQVDDTNYLII